MMPVVRIPDPVFERLQAFATPLIDTPASVIEKLLDFYEAHQAERRSVAGPTPARGTSIASGRVAGPKESSGDSLRDRFRARLEDVCRKAGTETQLWKPGRSASHMQLGSGNKAILIYFKTRSDSEGFWGVNTNRVEALKKSRLPWFLALLVGPGETGYLLKDHDVLRALDGWSRDQAGEYKVHEPRDLSGFKRFDRFDDLIAALQKSA